MSFGLNECAVLEMKSGRKVDSTVTELTNRESMKEEVNSSGYKYLTVLQMDMTLNNKMKKSQIQGRYIWRVKKFCRSKFNSKNLVSCINA